MYVLIPIGVILGIVIIPALIETIKEIKVMVAGITDVIQEGKRQKNERRENGRTFCRNYSR